MRSSPGPFLFATPACPSCVLPVLLVTWFSLGGCLAANDDDSAADDDDSTADDDDSTADDDDSTAADDDDSAAVERFAVSVDADGLNGFYGRVVTLQLNGAQDLVLDQDGSYAFAEGVPAGASYEVTLAPEVPQDACSLTESTGVLDPGALPVIGLVCAPMEWTGAAAFDEWVDVSPVVDTTSIRLDDDGQGRTVVSVAGGGPFKIGEYEAGVWTWIDGGPSWANGSWHDIATSPNGDILFVWRQNGGGLLVSHRQAGVWTHPASAEDRIDPDTGSGPQRPDITMNEQGDALLAWDGYDGTTRQVFVSEYVGGTWSHPVDGLDNISVDGAQIQYPKVALAASGDAAIVWQAGGDIYVSEKRGGQWTHPTASADAISPPSTYPAEVPSVAIHDDGTTLVSWVQDVGPNDGERVAYLSEYRDGAWTHPGIDDYVSPLGTSKAEEVVFPYVFFDGQGNGFLVWTGRGYVSISENRGGSWTHPADYEDNLIPAAWRGPNPDYIKGWGANARGDVVLLWEHEPQSVLCETGDRCPAIYKSEYRNGEWLHPTSETEAVSVLGVEPQTWDARTASAAVAPDGTSVVLWRGKDASVDCDGSPCDRVYTAELR